MPSGPKRKFNSYEEHFGTMAPRPPSRRPPRQRPAPTPETQELYNKMRREEEKPSFEFLRQQSGLGGFLQPPSPSIATATSPAPSSASATHSVTRAMNDMSVGGDQPRPKKPRAGRHGPLREATKHRAALMRKLGACEECRERRVKVSDPIVRLLLSFSWLTDVSSVATSIPLSSKQHTKKENKPQISPSIQTRKFEILVQLHISHASATHSHLTSSVLVLDKRTTRASLFTGFKVDETKFTTIRCPSTIKTNIPRLHQIRHLHIFLVTPGLPSPTLFLPTRPVSCPKTLQKRTLS